MSGEASDITDHIAYARTEITTKVLAALKGES